MVSGYKIAEVNAESIILMRGEDKIVITIDTQKDRKPAEAAAKPQIPGQIPPAVRSSIPPPIPMQPNYPPASIPAGNVR
jgi:hypothetical protein